MRISFIAKIILSLALFFSVTGSVAFASETNGTITSGGNNGYAWSNKSGWVNFGCSNCGISITDSGITGYAWNNNYGWINMKPANGGVTVAANGALSGYAWGSGLGWINFSGVSINSSGKFTGQASGTIIGALTFDCANCSVATDFRPQNFRTTSPSTSSGSSSSGAVLIETVTGPSGQPILAHINAFDAPLRILPAQSGTLTQNFNNQKSIILDAPNNIHTNEIIFITKVLGDGLFDVTAWDNVGNSIRALLKPVKITLYIPELLRDQTDLGVYFFDDEAKVWVKIPEAVFSGDTVSFFIDHLTRFAIFSGSALPSTLEIPLPPFPQFQFEIPRTEIELPPERIEVSEGEVPTTEIIVEENPPLFDIEINPGSSESKRTRTLIVIAIAIIAVAAGASYVFKKIRKN